MLVSRGAKCSPEDISSLSNGFVYNVLLLVDLSGVTATGAKSQDIMGSFALVVHAVRAAYIGGLGAGSLRLCCNRRGGVPCPGGGFTLGIGFVDFLLPADGGAASPWISEASSKRSMFDCEVLTFEKSAKFPNALSVSRNSSKLLTGLAGLLIFEAVDGGGGASSSSA